VNEETELRFTISATDADLPAQVLAKRSCAVSAQATIRIVYTIQGKKLIVLIVKVGDRKEGYR
jgi:hypothetical protein